MPARNVKVDMHFQSPVGTRQVISSGMGKSFISYGLWSVGSGTQKAKSSELPNYYYFNLIAAATADRQVDAYATIEVLLHTYMHVQCIKPSKISKIWGRMGAE